SEQISAPRGFRGHSSEKKKSKGEGDLVKQMLVKNLADGKDANEMLPAVLMAMLLDKDKGKESRRSRGASSSDYLELHGGSDSDESDADEDKAKGMKAVELLHRLHRSIRRHPKRVCEQFEKEVIEDLGIVKGQAWTLKDYVRKQQWGKFKGLYRTAIMDVEVYELLRSNQPDVAAAQVIQNLKSKMQAVMQGGDWGSAWLLTGLPDPLMKREFAGSRQEMSIISGYLDAVHRLQKRVRESKGHAGHHGEEDEESGAAGAATKKCNSESSFQQYFAWFQGAQGYLLERSSEGPLFPCALPYPEAILTEEVRGEAAEVTMWWSKAFLNVFISWGNFVTFGCPAPEGSGREPRVSYRASRDARVFADKLLGEMGEFVSYELVAGRLSCGGKRSVVESMLAQVQCTVGASYFHDGAAAEEAGSVALPVEASRVAIPSQAGMVDPCRWLEGERKETVQNLASLRKPEYLWDEIVTACHRVPVQEEPALADRMLSTGMAVLVPEKDLPRDSRGNMLLGGLFCVAKNETEDRLIFDRRPENATMHRLTWARLPAGACFARLLLGPQEFLRGSGHGLRNYYYTLSLPDGWVRYNGFGRRVCPKVVTKHGGDPKIDYRLAFRVLGMGDKNGCDIAQAVHEGLLRRHGVLDPSKTLVYGAHIPQGNLLEGVYLDDLLIAKKCEVPFVIPLDGSFIPPAAQVNDDDVIELQAAEAAYEEAGLERAEHKAFRQLVRFKAWGAEIDGILGKAGAPLEARRQVWVLIAKLVTGGFACRGVLQRVVGYLAFIFQYRRELYGLLHHMYKYLAKMPEGRWVPLPGHILDELRSCALHLPFATWNMRKGISSTVIATDATPTAGGAVTAAVPQAVAQALWRHTEVKGAAVRLDRDQDFLFGAEAPREASRFASLVSECLCWRVESGYSFRQTSHINLQEMRALKREVIKLAGDPKNAHTIFLFFNDSRVVCGALGKGRSSSYKLNGIIRTIIPHIILSGISLGLLWVETESNVADYPSRFRLLPPPCPAPRWLRRLGVQDISEWVGIEVFAESGQITLAHREAGVPMLDPWCFERSSTSFDGHLEELMRGGQVRWAWLAPPCGSFSPLRNLDVSGPLRRKGVPEGDPHNLEVQLGNSQWRWSLHLMSLLIEAGGFVFLVHPKNSVAWRLEETNRFIQQHNLRRVRWYVIAMSGENDFIVCGWESWASNGIPMSKYILQAVLVTLLATGFREVGLLRPGEMDKLFIGDDAQLIEWLRWWCQDRPSHRRVLRAGRRDWAKSLNPNFDYGLSLSLSSDFVLLTGIRTMPSRLAGALRELAAALEEEDWELVGSNSGEDPVAKRGPKAVERAGAVRGDAVDTTASSNVYHQDIRLEARLPGGQLFGSRVRLRKVADVDAAQAEAEEAAVEDAAAAAATLLEAVQTAAQQLGDAEVAEGQTAQEVLQDQASLQAASRWRAGRPLPHNQPAYSSRAGGAEWRPVVCGPSSPWHWLFELTVALFCKLVIRGMVALIVYFGRELYFQLSVSLAEVENSLVEWLATQLSGGGAGPPPLLQDAFLAIFAVPAFVYGTSEYRISMNLDCLARAGHLKRVESIEDANLCYWDAQAGSKQQSAGDGFFLILWMTC
ncbi:unnamed protein product, partial [Symbiodinium sp. KB8]